MRFFCFYVALNILMQFSLQAKVQEKFVKGEYVIKLETDLIMTDSNEQEKVFQKIFGQEIFVGHRPLSNKNLFLIKTRKDISPEKILHENSNILLLEPNYIFTASVEDIEYDFKPSDNYFNQQWSFHNKKQKLDRSYEMTKDADMKILKAWNAEPRSIDAAKDIVVAVIDTGINKKHEDLKENLWNNPGEHGAWQPQNQDDVDRAPGCWDKSCNKIDDDGNGLVDDIHGWNWVEFTTDNPGSNNFNDDQGHGSHCSGVIGAKHNDVGISGINNKVQLMALKFLSKKGQGSLAGAIEAIYYAINNGADVINASWGGPQFSQILYDAIMLAGRKGIFFVAAAGNDALNNDFFASYPANFDLVPGLVSVAATEFNDRRVYFSNFGKRKVHLSAPGHVIMSTVLGKKGYNYMSGTSMAAPHVSGLAAMLIGLYPEDFHRNPKALKEYLQKTSTRTSHLNWQLRSGGMVNAYNAVMRNIPIENTQPEQGRRGWESTSFSARSSHPYLPNTNKTFEIQSRGSEWIKIKFGKYSLEEGVDQVELYDGKGNLFDTLTGLGENQYSRAIKGDKIVVKFITDSHVNDWGYEMLSISSLKGDQ